MKKAKNRRKTTIARLAFSLIAVTTSLLSSARDFEYTYEGQTLTYTVLDEDAKTVKTKEYKKVSGDLILPEHPKDGEDEYTLTEIGKSTFFDCSSLTSITIPNSVTEIGMHAFFCCSSLTSVIIPNSVTEIGEGVFEGCTSLTSIEIPNSVTYIDMFAFSECSNLNKVTCLSEEPPILGSSCFKEGRELLYIPKGALAKYQASSWANYFMDIEELQDSMKIEIRSTDSDVHISVNNSTVTISGLESNEPVSVFDITGKVIYNGFEHQLTLKSGNIYILTTPTNTYKIAL